MVLALEYPQILNKLIVVDIHFLLACHFVVLDLCEDIPPVPMTYAQSAFSSYSDAMLSLDLSQVVSRKDADAKLSKYIQVQYS